MPDWLFRGLAELIRSIVVWFGEDMRRREVIASIGSVAAALRAQAPAQPVVSWVNLFNRAGQSETVFVEWVDAGP